MRSFPLLFSTLSLGTAVVWGCGGGTDTAETSTTTSSSSSSSSTSTSSSSSSSSSGSGGGGAAPSGFCEGPTSFLYDPATGQVDAFPDDFFTVDDATAATGVRVHMVQGDNVKAPAAGPTFATVYKDISTLDGFGTTAALALTFSAPLDPKTLPPSGEGSGKADASVVLVNLDSATPELVDFTWELVPEAAGDPMTTLVVTPLTPLLPRTRYGLVVTTRAHDAQGACVAPPAAMRGLLDGSTTEPKFVRLATRFSDLQKRLVAAGTITGAKDVSGAVVFTTQHTVEDSATIATAIRAKPVSYIPGACGADASKSYYLCEGSFLADDFRVGKRAIDEKLLTPQASYTLKVTSYIPNTGTGPFPTIIYGHGLNGDRHQAEQLAALAAPQGYAVVAIDAVKHGQHPDAAGSLGAAASFFGLSVNFTDPLDSLALRDNWRQSTYDKLQLIEMLRPGVNVSGDATPEVGVGKLLYLGVSLGGIMSAELTALAPDVQVSIPIVPGARVTNIIKDGASFAQIISLLKGQASDGQIARFFPVVQTAIDRGDAGAYTPHMVKKRLAGFDARTPQVLMQMVINDDTVPNSTNLFFARGLGVPHVGDELLKIGTIPHLATLPVSGNVDATHTGGVFQYDVVYQGAGPTTQTATHGNVASNPVAIAQTLHFISTHFSGVAEIIDPYKTLGIKP